jgi:AraC-like DNA-binding protein
MNLLVKNWLNRFKKYFFFYRDGFFEFPFLANSPELMIESLQSAPFVQANLRKERFTTNNLFLNAVAYFKQVDKGLWLTYSDLEIKKDLSFNYYYDENEPKNYHFLSFFVNKTSHHVKLSKSHIDVENFDKSWTLFKAGTKCVNSHYKGQMSSYLAIYFTKEWLEKQFIEHEEILIFCNQFIYKDSDSIHLEGSFHSGDVLFTNLMENLVIHDSFLEIETERLTAMIRDVIASFFHKSKEIEDLKVQNNFNERSLRKMYKISYLLKLALFDGFPGIQELAKKVGISETKLKTDFKKVYGESIYQYFRTQQMICAKEIILTQSITLKELAYSLSYTNVGKFSTAFKITHGVLPSGLKKK